MKDTSREGFQTVDSDNEEIEEKIKEHRRNNRIRVIVFAVIGIVILAGYLLWNELRTFESFEVRNSSQRTDSQASNFAHFLGNIIKYSNDGVSYMDGEDQLIWNQAFEMTTPKIDTCGDYFIIYDKGGTEIYILTDEGLEKKLDMTLPIQTVCVADQGTVAVLMKEDNTSYVRLFDKKGKELTNGKFYGDQGGFPIDIALSSDAQLLCVDMVDVTDGNVKTTLSFYNFGSVGQNEINNNVGTYSYSNVIIPEVDYLSDSKMLALGDTEMILFEGKQTPAVSKEIFLTGEAESVFYDDKYIGIVQNNNDSQGSHHIKVYTLSGHLMLERDTDMDYTDISFLENHEICVRNEYNCEIYTIHNIKKFSYQFDSPLYQILSTNISTDYIFVMGGTTDEVRLR